MDKLTWGSLCIFCRRTIRRGRPVLIFSTERPELLGLSHSTCAATKYRYGHYQMCPPEYISGEHIVFLKHFYPRLYSLPGGDEPNRELRVALAYLLRNYPASLANPLISLRGYLKERTSYFHEWKYDGDLETDFLRFLAEVQKAAKTEALPDADFRS